MLQIKSVIKLLIIFIVSVHLVGCSGKSYNVKLTSAQHLNLNNNNESLPVLVRFYELSDSDEFKSTDLSEIWNNKNTVLNKQILAMREIIVLPGIQQKIKYKNVHSSTNHIGVVALFRELNEQKYKLITPLGRNFLNNTIKLTLKNNTLEFV